MELTHPLPDAHAAKLKSALRLKENQALPDNVLAMYDTVRRTAQSYGISMSDRELLLVAVLANAAPPPPPLSFLDVVGDVARDTRILVKFRLQWRWARFVRVDAAKKIVAIIDDDAGLERKFQPTSVRLPTRDEFQAIGEEA